MNGSSDETQRLLDNTRQPSSLDDIIPNSIRSIGSLTNGQEKSGPNSNDAFEQEMDTIDNSTSSTRPNNYGYLEHIQSLKPYFSPEGKSLSKKVKTYNVAQLELITSIEDILLPKSDETKDHATAYEKEIKERSDVLSMTTLIVNAILVIVKIGIAVVTNSLSIISSLVDSTVDLLVSLTLLWTDRKIKNRDIYKYPEGRKRLEPISIVILSVIMCSASALIIFKSAETLDEDIAYFTHEGNATSTYKLPNISLGTVSTVVMLAAVVSKAILFVFCVRINNPTMHALAEANLNDVASNATALICGLIASEAVKGKFAEQAVVIDPIGAIIISIYIIIAWIFQANRQIRRLTGISAEPYFLQQITHIVYNYRPDVVKKIVWVQAVYHGTHFFVEAHIGLPGAMPLSEAHDIGTDLQKQLETIKDVERAFVHLDFQFEQKLSCEHTHT